MRTIVRHGADGVALKHGSMRIAITRSGASDGACSMLTTNGFGTVSSHAFGISSPIAPRLDVWSSRGMSSAAGNGSSIETSLRSHARADGAPVVITAGVAPTIGAGVDVDGGRSLPHAAARRSAN